MEAHGTGVLAAQCVYMERGNSSSIPVLDGTNSKGDGLLRRSASQQIYGCRGAVRPSLYARSAFPAVMYQSLPPHPPLLQQSAACPPLLPLPLSRSFSLPSPGPQLSTRRGGFAARVHPPGKGATKAGQHPARPRGSRPRDEPKAAASGAGGRASPPDPEDGDFTGGEVYALSPPANSLPMPSFFLRARAARSSSSSSTCSSEASGAVVPADGGADAGASDELRQLLRLERLR